MGDAEQARLIREERRLWEALSELRQIRLGNTTEGAQAGLGSLEPDMRAWAERLIPDAERAWQRSHAAAHPRGEPGQRVFKPSRRGR